MEFASCGGEMIVKCAVKAGWERLRYAVYYRRNIRELRGKLDLLVDRQSSVHRQIEEARRNGEMIEDEVQKWMDAVNEMTQRAQEMYENEREERESRYPNPMSRYRLGRRATELATEVDTRFNQSFARISYPRPVQEMTDMAIIGESSEGFDSRVSIVNEVMEALRDPNVKRIGLCGIGGVGKTTTAKEVARKVKGDMFNTVVMVQVTENPNCEKIQREIAGKVGMKVEDKETEDVRATRLCERLKQEKNMLLILDDLWEKLQFHKIGIPSDSRVLFTSRMDRLLADQMECKKVIKVDVMSEDEAWQLFTKEIVELPDDNEIRCIAKEIVGRCGRLPVRIVAAAGTLKNKKIDEWRDVLQRLKSPLQRNNTGIEEADGIFKVSYDRLSQESKSIFLLSAMLSHNPLIKDLMMCSVGLDLLQGVNTMEGALVRIHSLINQLKASNLLLDSSDNSHFAIHDVIRDVALSIASREEPALVLRNERLNRWLDKNLQKKCRSMCLDNCDINNLPQELSCPNLQFFLLNSKNSDLIIPTTFFLSTNKLKVMGFSDMHFSCLPSLQSLQDELQTLYLHSCALEDITEVGSLKSLTILSLAGSNIKRLPLELSQLTSLQMLNLARCSQLEVIPPNLLSSLKGLEVLDMEDSFKQWEAEGDSEGNGNASVDELKHLTNLSSLKIQIPDASIFPKDLFKDISLERYTIVIGREYYGWWKHEYQTFRSILYINSIYLDDGIQKLLENVEKLCSKDLKGDYTKVLCGQFSKLKHVEIEKSDQFDYVVGNSSTGPVASFSELVEIDIKRCEYMKAFVVSTQQNFVSNDALVFHQLRTLEMSTLPMLLTFYLEENTTNNECNKESKSLFNTKVSFPKLESMRLEHLNSLIPSIWDDHQLPQNSFSNLKTLKVWGCGFVKRLVPFHVLKSLSNLEELLVGECGSLEMVFDFEELNNYDNEIQLSWVVPLKELMLRTLPKLKHVWSNDPQEMKFFHEKVVHNLKRLELAGKFAMMIWNAQFPVNLFQSVQHLCLKLDGLVSFARGLHNNRFPNLQVLGLSGSFTPLKEFIPTQSLNEHSQQAQNLQSLILSFCHNLLNVGPSLISFANLIDIRVLYCERMTSLMTPSTSRSLVQLTKLTIRKCYEMEEIIRKQEGEEEDDGEKEIVFPKLESLELDELASLRSFCSHNYTLSFPSLQKVKIERCERMSMFCPGDIQTPSLKCVTWQGIKDEKLVDNNLNKTIQHLFSSQRTQMVIEDSNDLNLWIWDDQFPQNTFANLKTLIVKRCGFVERLVPFRILKSLTNLEELEVHECESLEIVFDLEELNNDEKDTHQLPCVVPLKKLELRRLPKLKHVWSNDPQQMVSFHSLQEVEASYCEKLTSMFPASIAERGLLQLEKLTIQACGINAIVAKELYVSFCDELEMFPKQVSSSSILEDEGHDTYPLFFQEKVVDNLKRLDLGGKLAMMIWNGQFPEKLFQNVQELSLELNGSISFAHGLCNDRLPNLQELNLNGWVKEFMPLLVDVAPSKLTKLVLVCVNCLKHIWNEHSQQNSLLQNIQTLEVSFCGDLINLGTSFIPFTNLTNIHVSWSNRLTSLLTSSTSRNLVQLTRLTISSCRVIEEIVRKQEGEEEDDVENEIVFQKLESLTLEDLPRLRSFCDHNYTFRFPSLEEVIIRGCERMSMFCPGNIHTPLLKCVTYREIEDEKLLDSNLNNTIQLLLTQVTKLELHPEMRNIWIEKLPYHMPFSRLEHLIVDNCDFLSEYAIPTHLIRFLSELKVLEVRNCHAIKTIFDLKGTDLDEKIEKGDQFDYVVSNSSTGPVASFSELVQIDIERCKSMKAFVVSTQQNFVSTDAVVFHQLRTLQMSDLPRISTFYLEENTTNNECNKESKSLFNTKLIDYGKFTKKKIDVIVFHQLHTLQMSFLPRISTFYLEENATNNESKSLFNTKVSFPKLESMRLEGLNSLIPSIWDDHQLPQNSFSNLKTLKVWGCGFVKRLVPFHVLKSLSNLEELLVGECGSLEMVFDFEELNNYDNEIQLSWVVPLKELALRILPKLKHVWSNDPQEIKFFHEKVVHNLKRLELAGKFAMMIWNAQFPVNLFQTVQHLCLELDGTVSFARGLHNNRFPNLQVLNLSGSFTSLKEFIPTQSLNEHSQQAQNLQILTLSFCDNLINMGPSLISFANLIDIGVLYCERMTSLMTPSTSRSLVQLTKLTIMNCYEMEEIIRKQEGEEEDDGEKEIVFPKLESLELDELASLRSFCSHNYTLSFPSLQKVSIEKCERMIMFCSGDIQTPSLNCLTWQGIEDEKLVDNNLNKTIQHLFSTLVSIPERMVIEDSNDLNLRIWDDQFPQNKFANLKTLIVKRCGFVERLVPFRILKSLTNLEELEVHECESLEIVFDLEELNNDEKDTHQLPCVVPLKKLELRRLPKLKHVWSNDPQQMVSFHSLQEVEASYCEKLTSMFPASIAERCFLQLEKLGIQACGINAIVAKELYVSFCDELEMFQKQVSSSSILEDEGHVTYPLFFQEKVVDNLKRLDLGGKLAMMIWNGQFPEKLFQNVQELSLELNGSISFAHGLCNDRLPNLQELNLNGWVKEFMPLLVDVAPSKLTKLVLVCVNCLKHIWNEHSQHNSLLQNIQTLEVKFCGDLINLGTSFIPFTNLTNIHVSWSNRLTSLLTSSTSRNLVQLTRLTISSCRVIEEIVRKQEGEEEDDVEKEIVFQKLESLTLEDLPRLRSFCDHNYTFRFPSLEEVIIRGCERMSMFCSGNIHTPLLKCVTYREIEDEKLLDSNLNNTIQLLLTQVTKLELHPEMRNIWMEKLPHHMPFSRLEHLIVDNCDFLSEYAIPTHLIRFLSKLKVLEVRNCHAIKTIFDLKGTDLDEETHKLVANIHLKKLKLHNLPNLKSVWIQDLNGSTCFQDLEKLYVGECESLRNIFVASVAKGLGQLKKLSIESCGVEEIIAKDETSKESPNFVFPQLNYLKLDKLPNLKCFYPRRCLFEWPQLTDLFVSQCGNVDVFGTEITSNIESEEEDEVETQLPLFFAEKVIPKLESLSLSQQDIVTLERNGQAELFHEVQKLCLESFLGELITFPYDFLGRFPNLNELIVNHCSFEEIFPSHVQAVDDIEGIAPFNRLCLAYLDQLKTIWNDDVDSQLPPLSQNLERLEVECCCSLVKLTPSSASLENLTHLKVSACHQLTYLVTNSTAKSLVNLSKLVIKDCEKMEEIITNENNDAEGKITFNELEGLELTNLPILKSFCLENQSFKFPKLDSLAISGCHQMKMFCHGVVKTPQLEFVIAEERIILPLERDLNKTIELLISDKDG